tara:strand:+ start:66203 stop:66394 length:192 start_codon:yes stop_codon:yes gene_type:complete
MKCFVAIEEDLLMEIWLLDPTLVAPFSRPSEKPTSLGSDRTIRMKNKTSDELPFLNSSKDQNS